MQGTAKSYVDISDQSAVDCPDPERGKHAVVTRNNPTLLTACIYAVMGATARLLGDLDLANYPGCATHVRTIGVGNCFTQLHGG